MAGLSVQQPVFQRRAAASYRRNPVGRNTLSTQPSRRFGDIAGPPTYTVDRTVFELWLGSL